MIGDATRIPLIQDKIKSTFQVDTLYRTLNSVECIAKGASLQAAMLSPNYSVADYKVEEYNSTPVSISYQFDDQDDKSKWVIKELFTQGSSFPSTKSITFDNKIGGMNLKIGYSQKFKD